MKRISSVVLVSFFLVAVANAQPGKGNANGHGNGNGSGNGDCGRPPCGNPHVPIDARWLLYAGIASGVYFSLKSKVRRSAP